MMLDLTLWPWWLTYGVPVVILALGLMWGISRTSRRSAAEKSLTERATERLYDREAREERAGNLDR